MRSDSGLFLLFEHIAVAGDQVVTRCLSFQTRSSTGDCLRAANGPRELCSLQLRKTLPLRERTRPGSRSAHREHQLFRGQKAPTKAGCAQHSARHAGSAAVLIEKGEGPRNIYVGPRAPSLRKSSDSGKGADFGNQQPPRTTVLECLD